MLRLFASFAVLTAGLFLSIQTADAGRRVALVIGNSAYKTVDELDNPRNDARDIAKTLKSIGFDEVDLHEDLGYRDLRITLRRFLKSSRGADVSLIYYAGHSIEVDNSNYLVPTDARLEAADDVEFEAIRLDQVRAAASGASQVRIIILDACRNNPFKMSGRSSTRSIGRGLARVEAGINELIAYSAKDGSLASDGEGTRNSPYTTALLRHMKTPGIELSMMFRRVKADVLKATSNTQEPYTYASLSPNPIYLNGAPEKPRPVAPKPLVRSGPSYDQQAELVFWNTVKDSDNPAVLSMYLKEYPEGKFAGLARLLMGELAKAAEAQTLASIKQEQSQVADQRKRASEQAQRSAAREAKLAKERANLREAQREAQSAREGLWKAQAEIERLKKMKLASLPNATPQAIEKKPDERDYASAIQQRLLELGCYNGRVDGVWGARSKAALARLAQGGSLSESFPNPSSKLLAALKNVTSEVCAIKQNSSNEAPVKPTHSVQKRRRRKPSGCIPFAGKCY